MKQNQVILILVLLLIFVVVWVGVNVYQGLNKSTISETTSQEIAPIEPTFDTKVIDKLKQREVVNPDFEFKKIPTPTPSKPSISSPSSNLKTQSASQEGKIVP